MRSRVIGKLLPATVVLAFLSSPPTTYADLGPQYRWDGVLEEIVVTARRREEAAVAVPMTLTRIEGELLDSLQLRKLDQYLGLSPGLTVYDGGDDVSQQVVIRGVVTPGGLVEPGNAIYVDEIYVSGMNTVMPGLYDIQSVQVLKGPQAGLYGRNTTGGAVVITTGQPAAQRSARLDASYADYDTLDTSATVNLPLTDALRLRATGWYRDADGGYYTSKVAGKNLDASRERGGRLTLAILPSDAVELVLTGEYARSDLDRLLVFGDGIVRGAPLGPESLGTESRHNVLRDDVGGVSREVSRVNGKLSVGLGSNTLELVAGWHRLVAGMPGSDFDGSVFTADLADWPDIDPAPQIFTLDNRDSSSQAELRFLTDGGGKLQTLFGVSYFEESLQLEDAILATGNFGVILDSFGRHSEYTHTADQDTRSWAGFAEVIWSPLESIELTADLRYTRDHKSMDLKQAASGFYQGFAGLTDLVFDDSNTFDNWSTAATFAYKPDTELTLFARYSEGFRSGGYNVEAYTPGLLPYDSEESQNFELGSKQVLFEGRLELGLSLFYLRVEDALLPYEDPGLRIDLFPVQNGGVGETTGFEADLSAAIWSGLILTASAGVYDNDFGGKALPNYTKRAFAPDVTASFTADYQWPLAANLTGLAQLGFRFREGGYRPLGTDQDTYHLLDMQIGVRVNVFEVAVFVHNALDQHYATWSAGPGIVQGEFFLPEFNPNGQPWEAAIRDPGSIYGVRVTIVL